MSFVNVVLHVYACRLAFARSRFFEKEDKMKRIGLLAALTAGFLLSMPITYDSAFAEGDGAHDHGGALHDHGGGILHDHNTGALFQDHGGNLLHDHGGEILHDHNTNEFLHDHGGEILHDHGGVGLLH